MCRLSHQYLILFIAGMLVFGIACGETENGENQPPGGDTAEVHGQLEGESEFEGKVVTAFEVTSDGSAEVVSEDEAEVEADGSYSLFIDLELYSGGDVYVEAEREDDNSSQGSVLVEGSIEAGASIDTAPITVETTFETDTYLEARQSGDWDDDNCTTADHRSYASAEAAAEARASADYQSEVEAFSRASASAMKASAEYLMEAEGKARADLESSFEARSEARAQLDADLLAESTDSEGAFEAYLEAAAQARSEIDLDTEAKARDAQASAEAFVAASAEMSADVRTKAQARAETKREYFVSAAVDAKLETLEAGSEVRSNVESAASDLRGELQAAGDVSAQASAWADFKAAVEGELEADTQMVLDELESAFAAYASAMAAVDASSSAEVIAGDCLAAYLDLWASAESELGALSDVPGMLDDDTAIEALVYLMVHLELAAGLAASG